MYAISGPAPTPSWGESDARIAATLIHQPASTGLEVRRIQDLEWASLKGVVPGPGPMPAGRVRGLLQTLGPHTAAQALNLVGRLLCDTGKVGVCSNPKEDEAWRQVAYFLERAARGLLQAPELAQEELDARRGRVAVPE